MLKSLIDTHIIECRKSLIAFRSKNTRIIFEVKESDGYTAGTTALTGHMESVFIKIGQDLNRNISL